MKGYERLGNGVKREVSNRYDMIQYEKGKIIYEGLGKIGERCE